MTSAQQSTPLTNTAMADVPSTENRSVNPAFQGLEATILASYAAFLVYLSFVPFDLTLTARPVTGERWILGPGIAKISLPDVISNFAFYLPVGAISFHLLRQRRWSRAASALWASIGAVMFSLAIECGQRWFPSRVPSWVDVSSDLAGAIGGIGLLWFAEDSLRRMAERARNVAARRWWWVVCSAFVVFVLAVQLRPYDPVVDPHHTAAAALRHADLRPWAGWQALEATAKSECHWSDAASITMLSRLRWEYGLDRLVDTALYAAVAALFFVGQWRRDTGKLHLYLLAAVVSLGLAVFVTGARIFLISYGLDTAHLICGGVGWLIGCWAGRAWVSHAIGAGADGEVIRVGPPPPAWQRRLALAGTAVVVLYEIVPFEFRARSLTELLRMSNVCLIPFAAHARCSVNQAVYDLSGDLLRYAILGVSLSMLIRQRDEEHRGVHLTQCVLFSMLVCVVMESLHLWMPSRFSDVTTIVMAAIGSFVGVVCLRWIRDLHDVMTTVVVEDLLTSQLIEGPTYQPLPATPADRPHVGTSLNGPAQFDPPR